MSPSSRRLTFIVGTSLLTASLATGCKKSEPTANPGPQEEPPHVNTAAPDEPAPEEPAPEEPAPDEPNVNTVPSE